MLRVCITGATGFIGKNLLKHLETRQDLQIIALSRRLSTEMDGAQKGNVQWRRCDGFSLLDVETATKGADILIYLIHSMLPSTSLTQGVFSDFDLYLADNFARAAKTNGIKKIVYLGGLIPDKSDLSEHLKSRKEVEAVLGQYGTPVTSLRAGLIVGKDGSSFRILEKLVRRLPLSICPSWTVSRTQPIDLKDVLATLEYTIDHFGELKESYDIGGPTSLTYREMMLKTAEALHKKRYIINVPLFSPGLSKLWVSKVTNTPKNLVYPLVDSLKHEMLVNENRQLLIPDHSYITFEESLAQGLDKKPKSWVRGITDLNASINFAWLKNATSIQRVQLQQPIDAAKVADTYFSRTPWFLKPLIRLENLGSFVHFYFLFKTKHLRLLSLKRSDDRSDKYRMVYYVVGGFLAHPLTKNGRLEFRFIPANTSLVMALLNFRPSLPWFIYKYTQAIVHLWVMKSFGRMLEKRGASYV